MLIHVDKKVGSGSAIFCTQVDLNYIIILQMLQRVLSVWRDSLNVGTVNVDPKFGDVTAEMTVEMAAMRRAVNRLVSVCCAIQNILCQLIS